MAEPQACRSVEALIASISAGQKAKYVFFWGHTPRIPGQIDQSCLSNWFPAPFRIDDYEYPTTEHYMMAEKARLFGDQKTCTAILATRDPGKAKALGRKVSNFDEATWQTKRFEIVVAGNEAKFSQHGALQNFLLETGSKVLVEASPQDRIWGIGLRATDSRAADPVEWNGLNLLGFALMEVRSRIRRLASRS